METNALDQLVRELGPRLYRYFLSRFSQPDSSDLTQETLIRFVRKIREGAFDPRRGNLAMFAFGIARYVALEFRKAPVFVVPQDMQVSNDEGPEMKLIDTQSTATLRHAILQLSPIQQDVIGLMIDEEMTLKAIATILDLPEGTVKSHVHRAKTRLAEILESPRKVTP